MSSRGDVLISAEELIRLVADGDQPAVLDVRWRLDRPDGRADYLAGHVPGAVYVSLDDELSDHGRTGAGRHPLPSGADLQTAARRWGVRNSQSVVVYDDWNRAGSSRAWWVLTAAGIADVRILDGGLAAWTAAGGEVRNGEVTPTPGDVTVGHDNLYAGMRATLTAQQVSEGQVSTLLDARAPERFRGDVEPVDPVAGHIPGAGNLPSTSVLAADGTFLPDAGLTELFRAARIVGSAEVGVYCGSGITASVLLAALSVAGIDAALFPGSWSQWSSEPDRRTALGPE
jgi:thiosulfate/3-mercaptopyruvate sulfurtransferase